MVGRNEREMAGQGLTWNYFATSLAASPLTPSRKGRGRLAGWSDRREHRYRRTVFARDELQLYVLADLQRGEVAVDEVGHHRRTFLQRDVPDRVRRFGTRHHAERVDLAPAGCL